MDFRSTRCAWCRNRTNPLDDCTTCPKYLRYGLGLDLTITMDDLCPVCINRKNPELEVFCRTNRSLQEGSGEDFECYNFCISGSISR